MDNLHNSAPGGQSWRRVTELGYGVVGIDNEYSDCSVEKEETDCPLGTNPPSDVCPRPCAHVGVRDVGEPRMCVPVYVCVEAGKEGDRGWRHVCVPGVNRH